MPTFHTLHGLRDLLLVAGIVTILSLCGCKTPSRSTIAASSTIESPDGDQGEISWVLVPNVDESFSSAIITQLMSFKQGTLVPRICLYFDSASDQQASGQIQPNVFQLWLDHGDVCGEWDQPNDPHSNHQLEVPRRR